MDGWMDGQIYREKERWEEEEIEEIEEIDR